MAGSQFVDWDDDTGGGDSGSQFLRLKANNTYTIRLVSKPVKYLQHWQPIICRSPGKDEDGKPLDPLIEMGISSPKPRYAIWVFHRDDGNRLKLMDFPGMLLEIFRDWKKNFNGEEPGGKNGPDFKVTVELPPGADRRRTKYKSMPLDRAPFTEEELEILKKGIDGMKLKDKLLELRRENTPAEIRQMMKEKDLGGGGGSDVQSEAPASQAPAQTQTQEQAPAASSSDDDDLDF
jgi:hypothetical protein